MTSSPKQSVSCSGILIAGPARCGKTTLAVKLVGGSDTQAVLTVDAMFPAFRSNKVLRSQEERTRFVREYLLRPRYMDAARRTVRCPADDMGDCLETLVEKTVQKEAFLPLNLIAAAFDTWAASNGKNTWIAPDLHAEIYFRQIVQEVPNLQMIVLLRDPREAVAASLYWRTYPERTAGGLKMMIYRLLLWCLSAETGYRLARGMKDRVRVVFVDWLMDPADRRPRVLFPDLTIPPPLIGDCTNTYFNYVAGQGWLGPDGKWKPLLSDDELDVIEQVSRPWITTSSKSAESKGGITFVVLGTQAMLSIVLGIARFSPGLAKSLMEFALFPISRSRNVLLNLARVFLGKTIVNQTNSVDKRR